MNKIASQDMRQHLMLNQSRLRTPEEVAQEIEDCWDAAEEFSRDDKGQAGFIAPTLEREARRVKEKCTKRSDSNPSVVSRDVLEDTERSVGSNKNIQRAIHHKTRHKEKFANGQTQRRKSKGTASPKVKVKAKAKARETSRKREPQPGPGWISR